MQMRLAVVLLMLMSLSAPSSWAQDSSVELQQLVDRVSRAHNERSPDHERTITELNELARQINSLIEKGTLAPREKAAAYFYRGTAEEQINELYYFDGKKPDESIASQALADLDKVVADGIEYPQLGVSAREALYLAGIVAAAHLHSDSRAFSYWEKCAALDHAGCLNIMANARLIGQGNQKVDFRAAIAYHVKVVDTGTTYHCAGAYSAQSIAAIVYFTGTPAPQGDELYWIGKARDLAEQVSVVDEKGQGCERSGIFIDEFLYQLARGDRREGLLDDASAKPLVDANITNAVVGLLSGRLTPSGFSSAMRLAKSDLAKCSGYFRGLWYAELIKRYDLAQIYYQSILGQRMPACGAELIFARKFKITPHAGK